MALRRRNFVDDERRMVSTMNKAKREALCEKLRADKAAMLEDLAQRRYLRSQREAAGIFDEWRPPQSQTIFRDTRHRKSTESDPGLQDVLAASRQRHIERLDQEQLGDDDNPMLALADCIGVETGRLERELREEIKQLRAEIAELKGRIK